jgi:hypothetical protein
MRTTLDLDDALLRDAKKRAAELGVTLTAYIEDALRVKAQPPLRSRPFKLRLVTRKGRALPEVDPSDRDRLYDVMEGRE